jgi:hypothetical protein
MATKKSISQEEVIAKEELVVQPEVTETVEQFVEKQQVPVGEDGILDRAYMSIKYKK